MYVLYLSIVASRSTDGLWFAFSSTTTRTPPPPATRVLIIPPFQTLWMCWVSIIRITTLLSLHTRDVDDDSHYVYSSNVDETLRVYRYFFKRSRNTRYISLWPTAAAPHGHIAILCGITFQPIVVRKKLWMEPYTTFLMRNISFHFIS